MKGTFGTLLRELPHYNKTDTLQETGNSIADTTPLRKLGRQNYYYYYSWQSKTRKRKDNTHLTNEKGRSVLSVESTFTNILIGTFYDWRKDLAGG